MYWADSGIDLIRRANLDGTDMEDLITTGVDYPADLELDATSVGLDYGDVLPGRLDLQANVPNPFNPNTIIRFTLPSSQIVRLDVYSIHGRRVATLLNERRSAGTYAVSL
jgi:hypothetical protein